MLVRRKRRRQAEWLERAPKGQRNLEGLVTSVSPLGSAGRCGACEV